MPLQPNEVKTENIANNAVTTPKIADEAITAAKLDEGSVTEEKIAHGAVTASKIADGQIYGAKLHDGAVTPAKLSFTPSANPGLVFINPVQLIDVTGTADVPDTDIDVSANVPAGATGVLLYVLQGLNDAVAADDAVVTLTEPAFGFQKSIIPKGRPGTGSYAGRQDRYPIRLISTAPNKIRYSIQRGGVNTEVILVLLGYFK